MSVVKGKKKDRENHVKNHAPSVRPARGPGRSRHDEVPRLRDPCQIYCSIPDRNSLLLPRPLGLSTNVRSHVRSPSIRVTDEVGEGTVGRIVYVPHTRNQPRKLDRMSPNRRFFRRVGKESDGRSQGRKKKLFMIQKTRSGMDTHKRARGRPGRVKDPVSPGEPSRRLMSWFVWGVRPRSPRASEVCVREWRG